jgi:hypothetical protein
MGITACPERSRRAALSEAEGVIVRSWLHETAVRLFSPDAYVENVVDIDIDCLCCAGIRGVVLDFDNTIVGWHVREPAPNVRDWIRALRDRGLDVCIISNAARPFRVKRVAESLGVQYVGRAFKPYPFAFHRAIRRMKLHPRQVAMIGDQIFTDTMGGNRAGMFTILVKPIVSKDFLSTRVSRAFERFVLRWLWRNGLIRKGMVSESMIQ